jgi:hypothetical protein
VSAAQALQDLEGDNSNFISTGLAALDESLNPGLAGAGQGGIQKGHVTEIWGPPGVGKTALGYSSQSAVHGVPLLIFLRLQLASHCLSEGRGVVWVGPLCLPSPQNSPGE